MTLNSVTAGKSSCANRWKYSILNHILKIQGAELGEEESLAEARELQLNTGAQWKWGGGWIS
jgi:hypothetical protein